MLKYVKHFDHHGDSDSNYRDADAWLHPRCFRSPVIDFMSGGDVIVTLHGEDAKRALDEDYPIEPGGFRLGEPVT